MQWRRRILLLLILGSGVGAILWAFMPRPVLVETARVRRGPMQVTIDEEGKTRIIDRFAISAPVPGVTRRIELEVGDEIRRGQAVVVLEPLQSSVLDPRSRAEAEARVAAAEARIRSAEENVRAATADSAFWSQELERIHLLHERGIVPRAKLEEVEAKAQQTEANLRSARFAVDLARFELEAARTVLGHSAAQPAESAPETVTLRAPVSGRVLQVFDKSQRVVGAGEALLEVGDPRSLEVEVELLSADAVRVAPGTRVIFERWGGEDPLEGRVKRVEPVGFTKISALGVEEQRVRVIADIVSPAQTWDSLGHGYRVDARFILWEEKGVLQVPTSALFRRNGDWAVFIVNDAEAVLRNVEIGRRGGFQTQILSGLAEGENVITHPDETIENGTQVRVNSS